MTTHIVEADGKRRDKYYLNEDNELIMVYGFGNNHTSCHFDVPSHKLEWYVHLRKVNFVGNELFSGEEITKHISLAELDEMIDNETLRPVQIIEKYR